MSRKGRDLGDRSAIVRGNKMDSISLEDWKLWRQQGCTRLPVVSVINEPVRPASWSSFANCAAMVLLESAQAGRYTYLCDRPRRVILGRAEAAEVWTQDCATRLRTVEGKPLEVLQSLLAETKAPELPGWPAMAGGLMGALGYDVVRSWEKLPLRAHRDRSLPLYAMVETADVFIYDEVERVLRVVVWSDAPADAAALADEFRRAQENVDVALARWRERCARNPAECGHKSHSSQVDRTANPPPSFSSEGFQAAVQRALCYIAAGDTYQVNLSLRTSRTTNVPPEQIFDSLRAVNPSPYMGLLRVPGFALVCGSPELLVRLEGGVVSSRPIAGTRPRGTFGSQDSEYSAELFASEKERAEHLMLVDLIRNDIGRVAEFGSVQVKEFMMLERYSHVMHIVSQVEGRLAAGQTWVEVFRSMFPGGTITGCPKIRTMEIIEELEPVGREFYTGALGWISYTGEMAMNIIIRSMTIHAGVASVQAGAGIVADSQPDRELDEAQRKAQALWVALDNTTNTHG